MTSAIILESVVTCPDCSEEHPETMPIDACQLIYECPGCGAMLRPRPGDCCIYCSYGSMICPPMQIASSERCCG